MAQRRQRMDREDAAAAAERRDARMMDGVASDGGPSGSGSATADEETFVDTTNSGPVPASGSAFQPGHTSSLRETQHGEGTRHNWNHQQPPTAREASDRAIREQGLDNDRSGSSEKRLTFEDQTGPRSG